MTKSDKKNDVLGLHIYAYCYYVCTDLSFHIECELKLLNGEKEQTYQEFS